MDDALKDLKIPIAGINRIRFNLDGAGVRTLVVTQGCPLRCVRCINAFTQDPKGKARFVTPQQLYNEIEVDKMYFIATGGGVTIGGGEPLLHAEGITKFCRIVDGQFKVGIETSLNAPRTNLEKLVGLIDFYLVDIKTMNPEIYRRYTGGNLKKAAENLSYLLEKTDPGQITVRLPVIPDYVDEEEREYSRLLLENMGVRKFDLFEYV